MEHARMDSPRNPSRQLVKSILLFRRADEVAVTGWSLICHDPSLAEIGTKLDMLQEWFEKSASFFMSNLGSSLPIKLPKVAETSARLAWFHPEPSGVPPL